jgi:hypothetical protein
MKLDENPRIPAAPAEMVRVLQLLFRQVASQVNGLSLGKISVITNAYTAAPTAGDFAIGDTVKNSAPSELGAPGTKYVITGWICTDDSPLTFLECRTLTGN